MKEITWPEVFITGELDETKDDASHCQDGLYGWECTYLGPAPGKFVEGMQAIGRRLKITPTEKELSKLAAKMNNDWLTKKFEEKPD